MIDIIVILFIVACIVCFAFRRPKIPPDLQTGTPEWKDDLAKKVRDIEDSSHLKQQYATALQELGEMQSQLRFAKAADMQKGALIMELQAACIKQKQEFDKLLGQKKSSEVRTGALTEALLPLSEDFPVDPKSMRFLGSPIDYVAFEYDKDIITFVEVKSGESQLNENQRRVKKMVEEGKVQFKVVRLNEKGIKIK